MVPSLHKEWICLFSIPYEFKYILCFEEVAITFHCLSCFCFRVIFPQILNLNSFITQAGPVNKEEIEPPIDDIAVKCDDSSTTDSGSALDDESCQGTEAGLSAQENDYQVIILISFWTNIKENRVDIMN